MHDQDTVNGPTLSAPPNALISALAELGRVTAERDELQAAMYDINRVLPTFSAEISDEFASVAVRDVGTAWIVDHVVKSRKAAIDKLHDVADRVTEIEKLRVALETSAAETTKALHKHADRCSELTIETQRLTAELDKSRDHHAGNYDTIRAALHALVPDRPLNGHILDAIRIACEQIACELAEHREQERQARRRAADSEQVTHIATKLVGELAEFGAAAFNAAIRCHPSTSLSTRNAAEIQAMRPDQRSELIDRIAHDVNLAHEQGLASEERTKNMGLQLGHACTMISAMIKIHTGLESCPWKAAEFAVMPPSEMQGILADLDEGARAHRVDLDEEAAERKRHDDIIRMHVGRVMVAGDLDTRSAVGLLADECIALRKTRDELIGVRNAIASIVAPVVRNSLGDDVVENVRHLCITLGVWATGIDENHAKIDTLKTTNADAVKTIDVLRAMVNVRDAIIAKLRGALAAGVTLAEGKVKSANEQPRMFDTFGEKPEDADRRRLRAHHRSDAFREMVDELVAIAKTVADPLAPTADA